MDVVKKVTEINSLSGATITDKLVIYLALFATFVSLMLNIETWFKAKIKEDEYLISKERIDFTERIAALTEPDLFLSRRILPLLRLYGENSDFDLNNVRELYLKKFGINLNFYQFNDIGTLTQTAPNKAYNTWIMRQLFSALRERDSEKATDLAKIINRRIQFAFGYGKDLNSFYLNPETIIETAYADKPGFLAWTSRKKGGLIVYCTETPSTEQIFSAELKLLKTDLKIKSVGLLSRTILDNDNIPSNAYRYLANQSTNQGFFANSYWSFVETASGRKVYVQYPIEYSKASTHLIYARQILSCLFLFIILTTLIKGVDPQTSIKKTLIMMFLISSIIPLTNLTLGSLESKKVQEQTYSDLLRAGIEETVDNITQNFFHYLPSCSQTLLEITKDPGNCSLDDPKTNEMIKKIREIFPQVTVEIRNTVGQLIFHDGLKISEGRDEMFKALSRRIVERYEPERLSELSYKGNPFADIITKQDDMGISTTINHPNSLAMINTGNSKFFGFFRTYPAGTNEAAILRIEVPPETITREYFKSIQNSVIAINNQSLQLSVFSPRQYKWLLSPRASNEQEILKYAETTVAKGVAQFYPASESTSGFVYATISELLAGTCIVAFFPKLELTELSKELNSFLLYGLATGCFFVFLILSWIYRQLITPLANLEDGIKALASRNFVFRLKTLPSQDELSNLFEAFNNMMAEHYDLKIARKLQANLSPKQFPQTDEYSLFGTIEPVSELGGDCLDSFVMENGNILFLIGDVTGHGVGSALITAFVKAITFHWSTQKKNSPASLADEIDTILRQSKIAKIFMGLICGILDTKTHSIELVVRGHIYPMLLKSNNETKWVGKPAYPLGIAKQVLSSSIEILLEKGDTLIAITDGFIEGRSRGDEQITFERIENWVLQTKEPNIPSWISAIKNISSEWCKNQQSDDMSFFILHRKGENNEG